MSAASKKCSICARPPEECGIMAGTEAGVYVCASCAHDVLESIRLKEEERAVEEASVPLEREVLDALGGARTFIENGIRFDLFSEDQVGVTLPRIRRAIERIREVSA